VATQAVRWYDLAGRRDVHGPPLINSTNSQHKHILHIDHGLSASLAATKPRTTVSRAPADGAKISGDGIDCEDKFGSNAIKNLNIGRAAGRL
jgi:hypothetical protein